MGIRIARNIRESIALANFLESVMRRGAEMDTAIGEHEQTREELLAEGLNK